MAEEVSLEGYEPAGEVSLEGYAPAGEADLKGYAPAAETPPAKPQPEQKERPLVGKMKAAGRALLEPFTRELPKPEKGAVGRPATRGGFNKQVNEALLDKPQVEYGKLAPPVQGPLPSPQAIVGGAAETGKGFLSGLGQAATGVGELAPFIVPGVPQQVGDYAAEWTKYLQSIGAPGAQTAGRAVGAFAPGVAGTGAARALLGPRAAGPSRVLDPRVMKEAAAGGAAMGAAAPTGKTDAGERLLEKGIEAGVGAAGGALIPPAATLAGRAGSRILAFPGKVKTYLSDALGTKTKGAVEDVRGTMAQQAKGVAGEKAAEIAKHEAEIERLGKIREQIASREQVRTAEGRDIRQADDPKAAAELQSRVAAQLRDRVRDSENAAKEAGLKEDAARRYAIQQEERLIETEQAAQRIIDEQASRPAAMTPEELGAKIQQTATVMRDKYAAARMEESGFTEALKGPKGQAPVKVKDALDYIESIEKDLANPEAESIIRWIKSRISPPKEAAAPGDARAAAEALFGQQGAPAEKEAAISLLKADDLRKTLNGIISDKKLRLDNGVDARASAVMHHVKEIRKRLVESAAPQGSEYREALRKWAALSKPLRPFESKKGALKGVTQELEYGEEAPLEQTAKVVASVLNKTREGAPAIKILMQEEPGLQDALRQHFNRELFGFEDASRKATQTTFSTFLKNNRAALEQSGLYDEFSSLARARATQQAEVERAKAAARAAEKEIAPVKAERQALESETEKARSLLGREEKREAAALTGKITDPNLPVKELPGKPLTTPEDVAKAAEKKAMTAETRTKKAAEELTSAKQKLESVKTTYEEFESKLANAKPEEVKGLTESLIGSLRRDGKLDQAQADALREKIGAAVQKYDDFKDARREIRNAFVFALVSGGLGWLGSRVAVDTASHMLPGGR